MKFLNLAHCNLERSSVSVDPRGCVMCQAYANCALKILSNTERLIRMTTRPMIGGSITFPLRLRLALLLLKILFQNRLLVPSRRKSISNAMFLSPFRKGSRRSERQEYTYLSTNNQRRLGLFL